MKREPRKILSIKTRPKHEWEADRLLKSLERAKARKLEAQEG
jgi:hypothetical protein